MHSYLTKWGNSLGVRIPYAIAKQVGMCEGERIKLIIKNKHIIIQKTYQLEALLSRVTRKNIHSEIDPGPNVGKEK